MQEDGVIRVSRCQLSVASLCIFVNCGCPIWVLECYVGGICYPGFVVLENKKHSCHFDLCLSLFRKQCCLILCVI